MVPSIFSVDCHYVMLTLSCVNYDDTFDHRNPPGFESVSGIKYFNSDRYVNFYCVRIIILMRLI